MKEEFLFILKYMLLGAATKKSRNIIRFSNLGCTKGDCKMIQSEKNRNSRRDKKRHAVRYRPVLYGCVKGFSRYEWFRRKQKEEA